MCVTETNLISEPGILFRGYDPTDLLSGNAIRICAARKELLIWELIKFLPGPYSFGVAYCFVDIHDAY